MLSISSIFSRVIFGFIPFSIGDFGYLFAIVFLIIGYFKNRKIIKLSWKDRSLKILSYFSVVIDGNGVTHPKPHPEVFLNGAEALKVDPSECFVFEDAASGIAAAKAGGFMAVGVGNPNISSAADIYFNDLTEFRLDIYA